MESSTVFEELVVEGKGLLDWTMWSKDEAEDIKLKIHGQGQVLKSVDKVKDLKKDKDLKFRDKNKDL